MCQIFDCSLIHNCCLTTVPSRAVIRTCQVTDGAVTCPSVCSRAMPAADASLSHLLHVSASCQSLFMDQTPSSVSDCNAFVGFLSVWRSVDNNCPCSPKWPPPGTTKPGLHCWPLGFWVGPSSQCFASSGLNSFTLSTLNHHEGSKSSVAFLIITVFIGWFLVELFSSRHTRINPFVVVWLCQLVQLQFIYMFVSTQVNSSMSLWCWRLSGGALGWDPEGCRIESHTTKRGPTQQPSRVILMLLPVPDKILSIWIVLDMDLY